MFSTDLILSISLCELNVLDWTLIMIENSFKPNSMCGELSINSNYERGFLFEVETEKFVLLNLQNDEDGAIDYQYGV